MTFFNRNANGQATAANSAPVVSASDDPVGLALGAKADSSASTDTGTFSLLALVKRGLTNFTTLMGYFFAEDAAHVSGDKGIQAFTVRQDTPAATAGTSGDYQAATTDASGLTWVRPVPVRTTVTNNLPGVTAVAYSIGYSLGTVMSFAAASATGRYVKLVMARIEDGDDGMGACTLHFFDATITVTNAAAFAPADFAGWIGSLSLSGFIDVGGSRVAMFTAGLPLVLKTNADANIYAVMVTDSAFTPASATASQRKLTLTFEQE